MNWKELRLQIPNHIICGSCIHSQVLPSIRRLSSLNRKCCEICYCPEKKGVFIALLDPPGKIDFLIFDRVVDREELERLTQRVKKKFGGM